MWSVQVIIVCVELCYLVGSITARCWRPRTRRYASESLRGTPFKYPAVWCFFILHWICARVRRGREGNIRVLTQSSIRHYCFILSKTCLNTISTFTTRRPQSIPSKDPLDERTSVGLKVYFCRSRLRLGVFDSCRIERSSLTTTKHL